MHTLVQILSQLTPLTKEEENDVIAAFPIKTFEKGTYLIKEGKYVKDAYFVVSGCIREYTLQDGEEKTTAFYTEQQSAVDFVALTQKKPSKINFICTEETTVAIVNAEKEQALYKKHPRFESFCRSGVEQMMGQKQEQLAESINLKPEQRYQKLVAERPELVNRVPQYQIASYLGIKPETLSRIRLRMVKNN